MMRYTHKFGQALDTVLELTVVLSEDMDRGLASHGLTVSRAHLLWALRQLGPTTQRTLADALAVSPRTITGLVDGLVATGFVTREPHPTDRRATHVSFTEHGARTVAALERGYEELAQALFAGTPAGEVDRFVASIEDLVVRLRNLTTRGHDGDQ